MTKVYGITKRDVRVRNDKTVSVTSVKPVKTITRRQIEVKAPYFGSTSLTWLKEESDYRKVSGEIRIRR